MLERVLSIPDVSITAGYDGTLEDERIHLEKKHAITTSLTLPGDMSFHNTSFRVIRNPVLSKVTTLHDGIVFYTLPSLCREEMF